MAGRAPRFFIDASLETGISLELPADRARQAATVLRLTESSPVILFNGDGWNYPATVTQLSRRTVVVRVDSRSAGPTIPSPEIHLVQALIKADRFDWVVQKAVELGVTRITPLSTERTVVSLSADRAQGRHERWCRIAVEAAEQSGRTTLPEIDQVRSFNDLFQSPQTDPAIVLWEGEERVLLPEALSSPMEGRLLLVVGPEGGFSDEEVDQALAAGVSVASLGPLTLRSETAAIAGIAAVRALADAIHCGRAWGHNVRISPA